MPDYVQDTNDSKKQVPGPLADNYYDRAIVTFSSSLNKTPNNVFIGSLAGSVGFFFGTSASFAALDFTPTGTITASNGSTKISGSSNCLFTSELVVGDKIHIISESVTQLMTVTSIESDTRMNTIETYGGGNETGSHTYVSKGTLTSRHYIDYGKPIAGTEFNIHPTVFSGSNSDIVTFIYKGGLDGDI